MLKNPIEFFYNTLESLNLPITKHVNNGLSKEEIEIQTNTLQISLPQELLNTYNYRNGIDLKGAQNDYLETWVIPLGTIMSIDTALSRYKSLAGLDEFWSDTLFPFCESTCGDFHLLDCDKTSETFGMVHFYSPTNVDFPFKVTVADSINLFFETMGECWLKGYFFLNENALFESDYFNYIKVGYEKNPKSDMWRFYWSRIQPDPNIAK